MRCVTALALILTMALPGIADWSTRGGDESRTGYAVNGPLVDDISYEVQLDGNPYGDPFVQDGYAYYPVYQAEGATGYHDPGVYRVDLQNGTVDKVMSMPEGMNRLRVEGDLILSFLNGDQLLHAYDLEGRSLWTHDLSQGTGVSYYNDDFLRIGDSLFIISIVDPFETGVIHINELDSQGNLLREWRNTERASGVPGAWNARLSANDELLVAYVYNVLRINPDDEQQFLAEAAEEFGVPPTGEEQVGGERIEWFYEILTLNRESLELDWNHTGPRHENLFFDGQVPVGNWKGVWTIGTPVVGSRGVYAMFDVLFGFNRYDGEKFLKSSMDGDDSNSIRSAGTTLALGLRNDTVYATTSQNMAAFHHITGDKVWDVPYSMERENEFFAPRPIVTTDDAIYVSTLLFPSGRPDLNASAGTGFAVHDRATGERMFGEARWTNTGAGVMTRTAVVTDGLAIVSYDDGLVQVYGQTSASLQLPSLGNRVVAAGNATTVDLSGTRPGVSGPATEFRVVWGDGATTGWTNASMLQHNYEGSGTYSALVQARNAAGHATRMIFNTTVQQQPVAEAPTAESPSLFSDPFHPDNVDMSFGLLGIIIAVVGGTFGLVRTQRHRHVLHREMAAIESDLHPDQPGPAWNATMVGARTRAAAHHKARRLTDAQLGLIDRRLDGLEREHQLARIAKDLDFLPVSIMRDLQESVADGQVTDLERRAVDQALERDKFLTARQKALVRKRLSEWAK